MRAAGAAITRLGLVDATRLPAVFAEIEPQLYRFPAVDPVRFRAAVERATRDSRPA